MSRAPRARRAACLLAATLLLTGLRPEPGAAANEARTAAETYERKSCIRDCLVYVARDLGARAAKAGTTDPPKLLLLVDTTTSMKNELAAIQEGLDAAWTEGPASLRVGVMGIRAQAYLAPTRIEGHVKGAIERYAFAPIDGPRNVMAAVQEAAAMLRAEGGDGPRALLLVTEEGGEAEEDVEATREALFDAGAAFYCIAGEAAFEHAWEQPFVARDDAGLGLTERYDPSPRRIDRGSLFYGSEVAFPLVPYDWEGSLAQTEFYWVRPPAYPVPSGFGYWGLATLAFTTGGRYFVFDFPAGSVPKAAEDRRMTLYDTSRLALLAPDLRPRSTILKALKKDTRATTIVRIWEHLANEATPIIQEIGCLERRGGLSTRPMRQIRSSPAYGGWMEDLDDVKKMRRAVTERIQALDQALKWWHGAAGRAVTPREGAADPLDERIEADFRLLGAQLRKVRFHWGEVLAAIDSIEPLDVTYRRVRLSTRPLYGGVRSPEPPIDLKDEERNGRLAELILAQNEVVDRYRDTPWALLLQKGWTTSFDKVVEILERETRESRKPNKQNDVPDPSPPPRPPPAPKPPPGPRPGSGAGGPTTGGG